MSPPPLEKCLNSKLLAYPTSVPARELNSRPRSVLHSCRSVVYACCRCTRKMTTAVPLLTSYVFLFHRVRLDLRTFARLRNVILWSTKTVFTIMRLHVSTHENKSFLYYFFFFCHYLFTISASSLSCVLFIPISVLEILRYLKPTAVLYCVRIDCKWLSRRIITKLYTSPRSWLINVVNFYGGYILYSTFQNNKLAPFSQSRTHTFLLNDINNFFYLQ